MMRLTYLLVTVLGGMVGMVLTGVFASRDINPAVVDQGLAFGETKASP